MKYLLIMLLFIIGCDNSDDKKNYTDNFAVGEKEFYEGKFGEKIFYVKDEFGFCYAVLGNLNYNTNFTRYHYSITKVSCYIGTEDLPIRQNIK